MLGYKDENDKLYGVTGMAVSLVVMDGDEFLDCVDVDAEPHNMVSLTDDYYFAGNPEVSARVVWNTLLKHFNLAASMAIANVVCRSLMISRTEPSEEQRTCLRNLVVEDGLESCSLERDEAENLFAKRYSYFTRVFSHPAVRQVADDFAHTLGEHRRMSRLEVLEALRALAML